MFEFIGVMVVAALLFVIIRSLMRAYSTVRSQEYGKELRYIAIKELKIPEAYFRFALTDIENVKQAALILKEREFYQHFSWPRLLAWTIYGGLRHDCQQCMAGNPVAEARLIQMAIPLYEASRIATMDPEDLLPK